MFRRFSGFGVGKKLLKLEVAFGFWTLFGGFWLFFFCCLPRAKIIAFTMIFVPWHEKGSSCNMLKTA